MLQINGKTFMNIQEAVAWLLANNALPFQTTDNFVADTQLAKANIVNPAPAEIKVGSLVLFADCKIGTVSGIGSNYFIVGPEYTDLRNATVHITNVAMNASGDLITTFSDGTTANAGKVKQITNFTIDASQHLIAQYNDGTSTDLGAIFNGNITISGALSVAGNASVAGLSTTGSISAGSLTASGNVQGGTLQSLGAISGASANISGAITGNSIIENMAGYSFEPTSSIYYNKTVVYAGAVKNGNKLTLVACMKVTKVNAIDSPYVNLCKFTIPFAVASKIFPTVVTGVNVVDIKTGAIYGGDNFGDKLGAEMYCQKQNDNEIVMALFTPVQVTFNVQYFVRYEVTFLLSDSLAS